MAVYRIKLTINYQIDYEKKSDIIPSWYIVNSSQSDFFIKKDEYSSTIRINSLEAIDKIALCNSILKKY